VPHWARNIKMADSAKKQTKAKKAPKASAVEKKPVEKNAVAEKTSKKVKRGKKPTGRNVQLPCGIYRFSRGRVYHKTAHHRHIKKNDKHTIIRSGPKARKPKKPLYVEKPIGGEKNGGKRMVRTRKLPKGYAVERKPKARRTTVKVPFYKHKRNLRSTITPGTILIVVAGHHRGKRVVFLKQLKSGLLLVNGPFHINRCPLRRIHQNYVIATKTKLNISKVKLPKQLGDKYFRRAHENRKKVAAAKGVDAVLKKKKADYKVSKQRKKDQKVVDKMLLKVIRAHRDRHLLVRYLGSQFALTNNVFPHKLQF